MVWFYIGVLIFSLIMVVIKSKLKQSDNFPPNSKRPKADVVRDFPDGCGSFASSTCQNKCKEGDSAKHVENASVVKEEALSVSHFKAANPAANIGLGKDHPRMRKSLYVKRDFPGCDMLVSPSKISDTNYLNLKVKDKLSGACVNYNANASGMSSSTLIKNKQLKDDIVNQEYNVLIMDKEAIDSRERVKKALHLFQGILDKVLHDAKGKAKMQSNSSGAGGAYFVAAKLLFEQRKWVKVDKKSGPIPGVQVGDKFQSRAELRVVGLHSQFFCGIDYMKKDGKIFATSVVASGRYENDMLSSGVLIYSGQGGNPLFGGNKKLNDQKLEQGNLALMNSKEARALVRVIRAFKVSKESIHIGLSGKKLSNTMYVYDGLYFVDDCRQERGKFGKLVFKFMLKRVLEQPKLNFGELMSKSSGSKIKKDVVQVNNISGGKEKVPIRLKNSVDQEKPPPFNYITSIIYPKFFKPVLLSCCNCVSGCGNSEICDCVLKNGGEMPYNSKGYNVTCTPIIYECGPCCKCSSSCTNRVTQNGIFFQLEVFKIEPKRWIVRSRSYIPKGSFVCEYIGEVLRDEEIRRRIKNMYSKRLCEGGSVCFLSYSRVSAISTDNFTIDATLRGNVGRFISHSNSPNLRAQYVLYNHSDVKLPHVMLFAIKDIPPLQELTYDFSCSMAKFGF